MGMIVSVCVSFDRNVPSNLAIFENRNLTLLNSINVQLTVYKVIAKGKKGAFILIFKVLFITNAI